MRSNKTLELYSQPQTQVPDLTNPLEKPYGDIYRLDAYPWMTDREEYEEGTLRETLQEHRDTFIGPRGLVRRYWGVVGFEDSGLPRRSEADLYLMLMLKTLAAGPGSNAIRFSYHELAPCLGLKPEPSAYPRISLALNRLMGVRVRFEGWITPSTEVTAGEITSGKKGIGRLVTFGILESYTEIVDGGETHGVIEWTASVLASLRSLAQVHPIGFLNERGPTDEVTDEASSRRSLLRSLLAPDARAIPAPE